MRLARAVDLWMGELARSGRTASTRSSYQRYLFKLVDHVERARADADNRSLAMEAVRDLTWASGFKSNAVEAHTGFKHPCK